jgi:hypothetical protein
MKKDKCCFLNKINKNILFQSSTSILINFFAFFKSILLKGMKIIIRIINVNVHFFSFILIATSSTLITSSQNYCQDNSCNISHYFYEPIQITVSISGNYTIIKNSLMDICVDAPFYQPVVARPVKL